MSKRHPQKQNPKSEFAIWLRDNEELIVNSGIPDILIKSEDHWSYFLDHGSLYGFDDDYEFGTEKLTALQRASLMRLLKTWPAMVDTQVGRYLVTQLVQDVEAAYNKKKKTL